MTQHCEGRVAIVTGAGAGLGKAHALALAAAGAKVVVNDMNVDAAEAVAAQIVSAGGASFGHAASVADEAAVAAMVARTVETWGRVDILVNNAGILRDKSFAKMELADFRAVLEVHLIGSFICTKAVWPHMVAQQFGRVIFTASGSGLFGNFGQSNYGAAKMGVVGLMQSLGIEGAKYDIRCNTLVPVAATAMTENAMPAEMLSFVRTELVSPGVVFLSSGDAPNRAILCAGGSSFAAGHITLTPGIFIAPEGDVAGTLALRFAEVEAREHSVVPQAVREQSAMHVAAAAAAAGVKP